MDVVSLAVLIPESIDVSAVLLEARMKVHFCLQSVKNIFR